jgi:preprotein translocase subunit SecG
MVDVLLTSPTSMGMSDVLGGSQQSFRRNKSPVASLMRLNTIHMYRFFILVDYRKSNGIKDR